MDELVNFIKSYGDTTNFTSCTLNKFERILYNLKLDIDIDILDIDTKWKYILKGYYNLLNNDIDFMIQNYIRASELNHNLANYYLGLEYYEENNNNQALYYFKKGFKNNCVLCSYMLSKIEHANFNYEESYKYTLFCIKHNEPNALYLYVYYNNYDLIKDSCKNKAVYSLIYGINNNDIECYNELINNYNNYKLTKELVNKITIKNNDIKNIQNKF